MQPDSATDPSQFEAPHLEAGRFFNPWDRTQRDFRDVLRWMRSRDRTRRPFYSPPRVDNPGAYLNAPPQPPSLTWVGHSTVVVQDGPTVWLTDPHFGKRAFLPPRHSAPGIPLSAIPPSSFVVLSHNHYDHLDAWTVARFPKSVRWYVPLGNAAWLARRGVTAIELDWWQSARHEDWTLTCLPAQHWSNRFAVPRNGTLWCSWLLERGGRRYYFAGDSGYFGGFADFRRRFGAIDVAMIPIGAYEPRWFMKLQHMNPAEAVQTYIDLGAETLVPIHWGTFVLTDEPLDQPPRDLAAAVVAAGVEATRTRPLAVGERLILRRD